MEQMAARILPPGTGFEWTALSYQEKLVGSQMYLVFGLGILLVYLVLAGQYESWYAPLAIVLSVPLDPRRWSAFDELVGHVRRYEPEDLLATIRAHEVASGTLELHGTRYLYAARRNGAAIRSTR